MADRIKPLETMLAQGQDSALLRFSLGSAYLAQDDAERAAEHLRQAIEQDANYSAAYKLLGQAHARLGDYPEAVKVFQAGIAVAESRGDNQAAKEMAVFSRRAQRQSDKEAESGDV